MNVGEKLGIGLMAAAFLGVLGLGIAGGVESYRDGVRRMTFMGQCIEKWSPSQCEAWDRYGRRDLAFRKDR